MVKTFCVPQPPASRSARSARKPLAPRGAAPDRFESLEGRTLFSVGLDADGWTVVTPAGDTRVVYVSSSSGDDSNSGLSDIQPVKTIAKARTLVRNNSADWLLLKRGDVFRESMLQWDKSGRSAQEPVVIGAYGSHPARPMLATGIANGFTTGGTPVSNLYVIGLHFNSSSRNPDNPADFVGTDGGSYGVQTLSRTDNLLFEDSVFDAYKNNVSIQRYHGPVTNVSIRRCQILDAYSTTGRSQGLYMEGVDGITLYQNLFDHNGWDERVSAWATTQNHNVYLHSSNTGLTYVGNISSNASSHGLQARGGGVVRDNLFLANPIGLSFGLVNGSTVTAGGVEGEVSGNVFLDSRSIGTSGRGWGVEIGNTKPGGTTIVRGNIFAQDSQRQFPAIMLSYGFGGDNAQNSVGLNNVTVEDNKVYKWYQALSTHRDFLPGGTGQLALNDLVVRNNDFQTLADSRIVLQNHAYNAAEERWTGNVYWDESPASAWFSRAGASASFDGWKAAVEPTAVQRKQDYADPDRTAGSYNATLGGAATTAAFVAEVRRQSAQAWRPSYAAGAVLNYVRAGFATDAGAPTATLSAADVTAAGGAAHTFRVTYNAAGGISAATLGSGDVRVAGPGGYDRFATLVSSEPAAGGGLVATYSIPAPGGGWDLADDGVYTTIVRPSEVTDAAGRPVPEGQIGSFRARTDHTAPTAAASAADVVSAAEKFHRVTVIYSDNGRLDTTTFDGDDVRVRGPNGFDVAARLISVSDPADGSPRAVVYEFTAPGGQWDAADAGAYTIWVNPNEVADTSGNAHPGGNAGAFSALPVVGGGSFDPAPTATLSAAGVTAATSGRHSFTVTYRDPGGGINLSTIDSADVRVTGPRGYNQPAALLARSVSPDGTRATATYGVFGPQGSWDVTDAGTYVATLHAGQVRDTANRPAPAGPLGSFTCKIPAPQTGTDGPDDSDAPTITSARFIAGDDDKLVLRFSRDVSSSLSLRDIVVGRTKSGVAPLPASAMRLRYNRQRNEVTITFPGLRRGQLADAHWRLTIRTAGVTDAAGNPLATTTGGGDYVFNFRKR